jgi:hypothetical protein
MSKTAYRAVTRIHAETDTALELLERRLVDGYARIDEARMLGEDVTAWEDFWIDLLHQYESLHDELPQAA